MKFVSWEVVQDRLFPPGSKARKKLDKQVAREIRKLKKKAKKKAKRLKRLL